MEVASIYNQFHNDLLRYVKSKVRSTEDAEDIVQTVFIKITNGIDKLSEDVKVKSWIFAITRNAIIDYYRAAARNKHLTSTADISEYIPDEEETDTTKGLDQCVGSMIKLLPDEYRDVIIESEINGVRQKDLAERYGMAYPSMRSKIQRGRERLKQLLFNCCHISTDVRGNVNEVRDMGNCDGPCNPCEPKNE